MASEKMVDITIHRHEEASPGRPRASFVRGLTECKLVGKVRIISNLPRIVRSVVVRIEGRTVARVRLNTSNYCQRKELFLRHSVCAYSNDANLPIAAVAPITSANGSNPAGQVVLTPFVATDVPFEITLPASAFRNGLSSQFISLSGQLFLLDDEPIMPINTIDTLRNKGELVPATNLVTETWYTLDATCMFEPATPGATTVGPRVSCFNSARFFVGPDLALMEPLICRALFSSSPYNIIQRRHEPSGVNVLIRVPKAVKNGQNMTIGLAAWIGDASSSPPSTSQALKGSKWDVTGIKVFLYQRCVVTLPPDTVASAIAKAADEAETKRGVTASVSAMAKETKAVVRYRLGKWEVPYYVLKELGQLQSFAIKLPTVLPSSANPILSTEHRLVFKVTVAQTSFGAQFKSLFAAATPAATDHFSANTPSEAWTMPDGSFKFDVVVSPFEKELAGQAAASCPWLLLPPPPPAAEPSSPTAEEGSDGWMEWAGYEAGQELRTDSTVALPAGLVVENLSGNQDEWDLPSYVPNSDTREP
ncbi:hypothetical protein HDU96_008204 [Phlyctochytrium bullatum]|nr:hypothetical protein HDU96_008204 [Phlyctochytrium bullatum]